MLILALAVSLTSWQRGHTAAPPALRVDRYGDLLPAGALARIGTIRLRHEGHPTGMAFHPNGKSLVSWSDRDETIRFWDPASGRELTRLKGVTHVAMAPRLKQPLFASAEGEGIIRLHDETGKVVRQLKPRTDGRLLQLVLSGDGKTLASVHHIDGSDFVFNLWHTATGRFLRQIEAKYDGEKKPATLVVVLTPDGGLAAGGHSHGPIRLYDVQTGKVPLEDEGSRGQ